MLGVAIVLVALLRAGLWVGGIGGFATASYSIWQIARIGGNDEEFSGLVQVGWGLYSMLGGGVLAMIGVWMSSRNHS